MKASVRFLVMAEVIKILRLVPYTMNPADNFYQKFNSVCAVSVKRKAILHKVFLHMIPPYLRLCEMDLLLLAVIFRLHWLPEEKFLFFSSLDKQTREG